MYCKGRSGKDTQLFFDPDKNNAQIKLELVTKWLAAAIEVVHPGIKPAAKRAAGRIFLQWNPLARVEVRSGSHYRIEWNTSLLEALHINREAVEQKVRERTGTPEEQVSWG